MTSYRAIQLTTLIIQDGAIAIPLLRLLWAFRNSKGDPLGEAMANDVLHHVWSKIPRCEEAMIEFISGEEQGDSTQSPRAA